MIPIYALHGFLGQVEDWDFLIEPLQQNGFELRALDLWQIFSQAQPPTLSAWAQHIHQNIFVDNERFILLGYSLGGRLAAQIMTQNPQGLYKVILVGAHLGLKDPTERSQRQAGDERWARRFLTEEWTDVMRAWNSQPIFTGTTPMQRTECAADRSVLAEVLRVASLGCQENLVLKLKDSISRKRTELTFVYGARDEKFRELAREWQIALKQMRLVEVPDAGHRAPWDNKKAFEHILLGHALKHV